MEPFVGLDGIEPSASPSRTGCAATALQSEVLRLPPENRVYTSPFPRNRVPLSRVCDADSAMAGRGTPAFVGTVGFEPTASRSQSARAAYCAMFRSRRRGESTRTPLRVPSRTSRIP